MIHIPDYKILRSWKVRHLLTQFDPKKMKKIFISTTIFLFGFYVTLSAQLRSVDHTLAEVRKIHEYNFQLAKGRNRFGIDRWARNYSLAGLQNSRTKISTLSKFGETSNFFRRWISEGSVQAFSNMTMAFSFTDNSVNDISFLFSLPIKKIKFL